MPNPRTSAAKPRSSGTRHRYAGPSQHPLSAKQKGIICKVARRAYDHLEPTSPFPLGPFDAWRHFHQELASGILSLTEATQNDYNDLVGYFEGLAGDGGRQFQAAYRQQDETLRQARHLLTVALAARELDVSYAEKICRDRFKRGLDHQKTTADNLFEVRFTVESRRAVVIKAPADATCDQPF